MWGVFVNLKIWFHTKQVRLLLFYAVGFMAILACTTSTSDKRPWAGPDTPFNSGDDTSNDDGSEDNNETEDNDGADDQVSLKRCNDFAGIDVHASVRDDHYSSIAKAGLGWVRVDFNWPDIQPKSGTRWNWDITDKVVEQAKNNNLKIFATLAYTPPWAGTEGCQDKACPPKGKESWRQFVTAVVDRYKADIHHWGLWNEPNLSHFWQGSKETYVSKILKTGFDAVKKIDSTAMVVAPDLAYGGEYQWEEWTHYIAKEAKDHFDVFAIHVYEEEGTGEDLLGILRDSVKPVLKKYGILDHYPVWLSEFGWRTTYVSEQAQSDFLLTILRAVQKPKWAWIEKVFIYNLTDGKKERDTWGILLNKNKDFAKKTAYTKIKEEMAKVNDKCVQ